MDYTYNNSFNYDILFKNNFILSNVLISCSGIAIILQVFSNIKKTANHLRLAVFLCS